MGKVTARDVARLAGCSVAAVSRAFMPEAPIAAETRARILKAAAELGYRSPAARWFGRLTTGSISLVAGDLTNPFYSGVLDLLSLALHERGQRLVVHSVPTGGSVDLVMQQVLAYRSDAAIVTSARMSSQLARTCRQQRLPVVLMNRVQSDAEMTAVTCDNYGGGRMVAERLIAQGRRRIGHVTGLPDTSTHIERNRGFLDALEAAGMMPVATICGQFSHAGGQAAAAGLLARSPAPDALFCENDVMALGALDAARARGMAVPSDLAVIGFDDIAMAGWEAYRLTTLRQPVRRMVAETLQLIDALHADRDQAGAIRVLPVRMVERATG